MYNEICKCTPNIRLGAYYSAIGFAVKKPKQILVGSVLGSSLGGYTKDKFGYFNMPELAKRTDFFTYE